MMYGNYGFGMGFGWIFMIIFWGVIIYLALAIWKRSSSGSNDSGGKETAEEILKKRYAHGEITKEEFERIGKDINK